MNKSFPKEVYLNGEWVPHDKATISVFDRGYLLGDGIYEVIPFYKGRPFTLEAHLDRLKYGLDQVEILYNADLLKPTILESIERSALQDTGAAVYMQITRGVAPRTHYFPEQSKPSILLYAYLLQLEGFEHKRAKVIFSEDLRWHRCDIKSISLMANVKANNDAHRKGATENVLIRNGLVTEGTHTSVFFVQNNVIYTHPKGPHILSGITRKVVIEICNELGYELREEAIKESNVKEIDEMFLAGTTTQVLAVTVMELDGEEFRIGNDIGPITKRIQEAFIKKVNEY